MAHKLFHFVINQQTSSLELFMEMKLYLVCMSLKGFKDVCRDKRSLKMIQGVGDH